MSLVGWMGFLGVNIATKKITILQSVGKSIQKSAEIRSSVLLVLEKGIPVCLPVPPSSGCWTERTINLDKLLASLPLLLFVFSDEMNHKIRV